MNSDSDSEEGALIWLSKNLQVNHSASVQYFIQSVGAWTTSWATGDTPEVEAILTSSVCQTFKESLTNSVRLFHLRKKYLTRNNPGTTKGIKYNTRIIQTLLEAWAIIQSTMCIHVGSLETSSNFFLKWGVKESTLRTWDHKPCT